MTDPTKVGEEERAREALREQAEEIARLDRALAQQYGQDAQSVAELETPAPRERLFSRRVLFAWALVALFAVFAVRVVMPVVFRTIKESVVSGIRESGGSGRGGAVIAPTPPTPPTIVTPAPETPAAATPSAKPAPEAVKVQIKKIIR